MLFFPKLNRSVDIFILSSIPIASSTEEGFILPVLHAEPFDTAIFFLSNFAISISDLYPEKEILIKPGRAFLRSPFNFICEKFCCRFLIKYSSKTFRCLLIDLCFLDAIFAARPIPIIPEIFSVPPLILDSCSPPIIKDFIISLFFINKAPMPFGP